jgi:hypothetical protein
VALSVFSATFAAHLLPRLGWLVGLVVVSRPWPCPKGRRDARPRASGWRRRTLGNVDEPVVAAEKFLDLAAALNAYDRLTRGHIERVRVSKT